VAVSRAELGVRSSKLELLANNGEGRKLLHSQKFAFLPIPCLSQTLPRAQFPKFGTSDF